MRDRSRDDRGMRGHSSDGYGPQHWGEKVSKVLGKTTKTKFQGVGNDLSDDYVEEELPRGGAGRSRARLLKKAEAHRFPPSFSPMRQLFPLLFPMEQLFPPPFPMEQLSIDEGEN